MTIDSAVRCACCDLPAYSCGRAVARRQEAERRAQRERALQRPGVTPARYPGRCPGCGERFMANEPVRKTPDGWQPVLCCPTDLDE